LEDLAKLLRITCQLSIITCLNPGTWERNTFPSSLLRRRLPHGTTNTHPREALIPGNAAVIHHFLPGFTSENEREYLALFQRPISPQNGFRPVPPPFPAAGVRYARFPGIIDFTSEKRGISGRVTRSDLLIAQAPGHSGNPQPPNSPFSGVRCKIVKICRTP
jgi:hypothetical protein